MSYKRSPEKNLEEKYWASMTWLSNLFKVTRNQIKLAVKLGIIGGREAPHPTRRDLVCLYLDPREVKEKLPEIRTLPKYSREELERRRRYNARMVPLPLPQPPPPFRLVCPRCRETLIEVEWGKLEEPAVREILKSVALYHYLHRHTKFDKVYDDVYGLIEAKRLRKLEELGFDLDVVIYVEEIELWRVERALKDHYLKEARKLAKVDFPHLFK